MDKLKQIFEDTINARLIKIVFGDVRKKSQLCKKAVLRPVIIKGLLVYQVESLRENKMFHENLSYEEAVEKCLNLVIDEFKQINIFCENEEVQILASKPEKARIVRRPKANNNPSKTIIPDRLLHNKTKKYIIPDGVPCDFLIRLGVMDQSGNVHKKHYGKFRQINRYLEIVDDCMDTLVNNTNSSGKMQASTPDKPLKIIDFGCGKAYLTFALYYYLCILNNYKAQIIGLDLKKDVIEFCSKVAADLKYEGLSFEYGDIADYSDDGADMVVTLHACDTATDYALRNAVAWHSRVILSVPCCQHELFSQIKNDLLQPVLKHGILKDRFTEILTDGIRGLKLEACGYDVSMIEFTSLEHTARNIMVKALLTDPERKGSKTKDAENEYFALCTSYNIKPTTDIIGQ